MQALPHRYQVRAQGGPAGTVQVSRREVLVGTGSGLLRLAQVQPQGKAAMPAGAWANGLRGEPEPFE